MAINIVFDHPGYQTRHSLVHMVAWLVGTLLVVVGLLATVVAIPSGVVTLGDLIGKWQHEQIFSPEFPLRQAEIGFAISTTVAFVGLRYGRRSIRGRRSVVLLSVEDSRGVGQVWIFCWDRSAVSDKGP